MQCWPLDNCEWIREAVERPWSCMGKGNGDTQSPKLNRYEPAAAYTAAPPYLPGSAQIVRKTLDGFRTRGWRIRVGRWWRCEVVVHFDELAIVVDD